jgi:hypothetical protein|tara:strand:- start:216 stop:404 length:189 start_codon:yes stop_codon:yes gene_type:complete
MAYSCGYPDTMNRAEKMSPLTLKDACYNKVVSRYGPKNSAYRSGAMAKCRKVGAANWGNSKK